MVGLKYKKRKNTRARAHIHKHIIHVVSVTQRTTHADFYTHGFSFRLEHDRQLLIQGVQIVEYQRVDGFCIHVECRDVCGLA